MFFKFYSPSNLFRFRIRFKFLKFGSYFSNSIRLQICFVFEFDSSFSNSVHVFQILFALQICFVFEFDSNFSNSVHVFQILFAFKFVSFSNSIQVSQIRFIFFKFYSPSNLFLFRIRFKFLKFGSCFSNSIRLQICFVFEFDSNFSFGLNRTKFGLNRIILSMVCSFQT